MRRASGISSPQISQWVSPSPAAIRARANWTASITVSSIWSCTAPSRVQPPAICHPLACWNGTTKDGPEVSVALSRSRPGRCSLLELIKVEKDDGDAQG